MTGKTVRFATFNVSMSADMPTRMFDELRQNSKRIQKLAAIIQHVNPDVLLLCEFDHPGEGGDDGSLAYFCSEYLDVSNFGGSAVQYPYRYLAPSNTGLPILANDDVSNSPERAQGFGCHHGQYGFAVLSRYPLRVDDVRSWQTLLWKDFPQSRLPVDYYSPDVASKLRLSSKNHVAIPVDLDGTSITLVACHPTPPVFDGPEKRNLKRNADELKLLEAIISNDQRLVDDDGNSGGICADMPFVVMGDLNADCLNGDGDKLAIGSLLGHARMNDDKPPKSQGALEYLARNKGQNKAMATHNRGLRLDYVLPSNDLKVIDSGVFWPLKNSALHAFITDKRGRLSFDAPSDHRLVWVDVALI
ncbi:endonuclease/exonuclease/phosphatase family protein [Enterovibrio sp. ZSDZ35]|uniref:Endonuclease/exonuclease/phosphatase family protein n=1 Tax=Enterovibrio qingdaonensis TaxID=2899818 RepID=A0ABT5QMW1_9GAMM|nr:endonuclease/exonuclease/phosphatase family protein [Enterovibrio sp. ZSDZ35]MDD1781934.1 endonuclease/exonuclease/phosphatase family protein [Enterovibrio sp. ZSDZ35]